MRLTSAFVPGSRRPSILGAALALALLGTLNAPPAHAAFDESLSLGGDRLVLVNLIGEISVVGHDGDRFEVAIHVRGEDASPDVIKIESKEGPSRSEVLVQFPVDEEERFVYPKLGHGSNTTFSYGDDDGDMSWLDALRSIAGKGRVRVSGSGRGMEVWADVELRVPKGKEVTVDLGVGELTANNVSSALDLLVRSGHAEATDITGDLSIDTGSGHVGAKSIRGNLRIDTGSGHVEVIDVQGASVRVDTGSGHVNGSRIECETLGVDTGSGHVEMTNLATDEMSIDTGSGGVEVELIRMGDGRFTVDTGSGGIELMLPPTAAGRFFAETGSGGIRLDVEDADIEHRERDEIAFRIGEGGADVQLETGSGGISIEQ